MKIIHCRGLYIQFEMNNNLNYGNEAVLMRDPTSGLYSTTNCIHLNVEIIKIKYALRVIGDLIYITKVI